MANTLSKLTTAGNLYTTGTLDEATFNPNSGYRKNLVNYSQTYTTGLGQTGWAISHTGSIVSTNELAPDGTYTAMRFRPAAQYDSPRTNGCWLPNVTQVGSVWVKVDSGTRTLSIALNGGGAGISFTATSTWQRIITPAYVKYVNYSDFLIIQDSNTSGFVDYLIWGAQVEVGSSATIYEPTGSAGALVTNTLSKLDTSGNYYTAGTIDEVTFNPNSGYTKNLLVNSNLLGGTSGVGGSGATPPTGYAGTIISGNILYAPALSGIGYSCRFYGTSVRPFLTQYNNYPIYQNLIYTFSVTIEAMPVPFAPGSIFGIVGIQPASAVISYYLNGVLVPPFTNLSTGATGKLQAVFYCTGTVTSITALFRYGLGTSNNDTGDITIANPQIEVGNTVTTSTSIISYQPTTVSGTLASTNALSKLDTAGNHYLSGTYDEFTKGANLVTDGLIYYFDPAKTESWNGNTTIYDITKTQTPGTMVGGFNYSIDGGGSIRFNGASTGSTSSGTGYANTGIVANSSLFQTNSNYTLSVWCKFEKPTTYHDPGQSATGGIFSWSYFAGYGIMWQSDTNGNITGVATGSSGVYAHVRVNGTYETFTSTYGNLILNQWYNFVMVYNSSGVYTLYVNGSAYGSNGNVIQGYYGNTSAPTLGLGRADIEGGGQTFAGRQTFPGSIGQALIYNRALSATEISQNFTEMRSQYGI